MHDANAFVDCRIGSLETAKDLAPELVHVDCRIGSLENVLMLSAAVHGVDCRIGSLERILNKRDLRLYC